MKFITQIILLIFLSANLLACNSQNTVPETATPTVLAKEITVLPTATLEPTKATQAPKNMDDLTAAEEEAGFKIRIPANLLKNYVYKSVLYLPEQQAITVQYVWDAPKFTGEMLFLTQQRIEPAGDIDKAAEMEEVQIGDSSAIFVQGNAFNGRWESEAPVFRLRWRGDGFFYTILFNGNEPSSSGFLTQEDLIALAEQLQ